MDIPAYPFDVYVVDVIVFESFANVCHSSYCGRIDTLSFGIFGS